MSAITTHDGTELFHATPTSSHALWVMRRGRGDGFQASIRGHILDLADPSLGHALAPTPDDLLIVSIASEVAWFAQSFLRGEGVPDDVSVSAEWRTPGGMPGLADINLTVTVPRRADAVGAALGAAFSKNLAARSLAAPAVHISFEG